ncbi:DNA replication and repair protein RecF [Thalassocella blandensis]|nr:DNA replication and repair protein RecF [Thalassocella blandensis]
MPFLTRFSVSHFRNLESVNITPAQGLNLVFGENGAGKSSLLEAIAFVSRAKSFRTNLFRRVIQHDNDSLLVFAEVSDPLNEEHSLSKLGVEKLRSGESHIRIDGETAQRASDLAHRLPLLVLNNISFDLLGSGAKERRQFFDWLVFHVKHEFAEAWKLYNRLIKQRNSLLRHDRISYSDLEHWDIQLVKQASKIQELRKQCLAPFAEVLKKYIDLCDLEIQGKDIEVRYTDGWKTDLLDQPDTHTESDFGENTGTQDEFMSKLKSNFDTDKKLGYTALGPHRSELKILIGRTNAGEILSRGQQKLLVAAMYLSVAEVYKQSTNKSPVILIDDLPSELDRRHQEKVGNWLKALESQTFIAGIDLEELNKIGELFDTKMVFHVKHGVVETAAPR